MFLFFLFIVSDKFVLVSYNLLGVDNASNHMDLYYNIPPQHLEWSRRKHLICKEISRYNATILCLQASFELDYILYIYEKGTQCLSLCLTYLPYYVMVSLIIWRIRIMSKMASFCISIETEERPDDGFI